jgi:hypothetical protein
MVIERSDKVYENWRQATEKFDYFVLGLTGALCAYISQQYEPSKIGLNPGTLELTALLIFVFAAIVGFKRIEKTMALSRLNHRCLRAKEERGSLMAAGPGTLMNEATGDVFSQDKVQELIQEKSIQIPILNQQIEKVGDAAWRAYHLRNWAILIGFLVLMIAKVWFAYV